MVSTTNICHWNIQGFRSNYTDLQTLLGDTKAVVRCLQETKLPEEYPLSYPRGFSSYLRGGQQVDTALEYWGVCTLVKNNLPHQLIPLNTGLQAVVVQCQLDQLFSIFTFIFLPAHLLSWKTLQTSFSNFHHRTSYLEISMSVITFGGTLSLIRGGA